MFMLKESKELNRISLIITYFLGLFFVPSFFPCIMKPSSLQFTSNLLALIHPITSSFTTSDWDERREWILYFILISTLQTVESSFQLILPTTFQIYWILRVRINIHFTFYLSIYLTVSLSIILYFDTFYFAMSNSVVSSINSSFGYSFPVFHSPLLMMMKRFHLLIFFLHRHVSFAGAW